MRGLARLNQFPLTKDNNDVARALFEQALKIDPEDPDALAGLAATYTASFTFGWTTSGIDYDARIIGQADRALSITPNTMSAFLPKAGYLVVSRRWSESLGVIDAGLAINPNIAALYALRGVAENSMGRFEQAKSDLEQAMRLTRAVPQSASFTCS